MTQLSAIINNFTKEELTCRCGCGRFNYDNAFLICLQAFRYGLGMAMTITGPGRCKKHNANEGGVSTSLHICEGKPATAVDFTCKDLQLAYKLACGCGLFNEVIWYKNQKFIHLGRDPKQKGNYFAIKV